MQKTSLFVNNFKFITLLLFSILLLANPLSAQDIFNDASNEETGFDQTESGSDAFSADFGGDSTNGMAVGKALEWTGFIEIEQGGHTGKDSVVDKKWIMSNRRFRLATSANTEVGDFYLKSDVINDTVTNETYVDLREARVVITPIEQIDISIGEQVNTWGVADMLFINDLFPKNWVANFLGRDMESMKDSANSMRITSYFGNITLDLVHHPEFAPDTTPTGCRLSVYDPNTESLVSNQSSCTNNFTYFDQPEKDTGETAARLKVQVGSYEIALYTYNGFFKNPKGLQWADSTGKGTGNTDLVEGKRLGYKTLKAYYPRLYVSGASVEGQLGPGIVALEAGLYQSPEDEKGDNPLIENSKWKYLVGYRADISANLSVGLQWYQERMLEYDKYKEAVATYFSQNVDYQKKELQNTYTVRISFKAQQETLKINLFRYQRPEDKDSFTKLDISKRLNDQLETVIGGNFFEGEKHYQDREFGMLENDDNFFFRVKYNF